MFEVITGIWAHTDGQRIAVQIEEDSIIVADYRFNPPQQTPVFSLEGSDWEELPINVAWVPAEQA